MLTGFNSEHLISMFRLCPLLCTKSRNTKYLENTVLFVVTLLQTTVAMVGLEDIASCGNACKWQLCGKWPDSSGVPCQEPTPNCSRKEFLQCQSRLPLAEVRSKKPLWIYFSGDSTGRQLFQAFLKYVAIDFSSSLGNFSEFKQKVRQCTKLPQLDTKEKEEVNAEAILAGARAPKWGINDYVCNWNTSFDQRPVQLTLDWRMFVAYQLNDLHVLDTAAQVGRLPTVWVVNSGVHDCNYLRRNVTRLVSSVDRFFAFLNQNPALKRRTVVVGMQYMANKSEETNGRPGYLYNCSRMLHDLMLRGAQGHGVYFFPRWETTRIYAERYGSMTHYPESVIQEEVPSLVAGLTCVFRNLAAEHDFTMPSDISPQPKTALLFFLLAAVAVFSSIFARKIIKMLHCAMSRREGVALRSDAATIGTCERAEEDAEEAETEPLKSVK